MSDRFAIYSRSELADIIVAREHNIASARQQVGVVYNALNVMEGQQKDGETVVVEARTLEACSNALNQLRDRDGGGADEEA